MIVLLLAIVVAAASTGASPARPVTLAPAEAESLAKAIAQDREDTRTWLKSAPTSYLATVRRVDYLAKRTLTVGSAADNDVRLDDLAPHHLRATVVGDSFRVEAIDDTAHFVAANVVARAATLAPSGIKAGRYLLRLSHQRFPAIIVFDPKSPRLAEYKGIDYFPIDLRLRYVLPLTPNPKPDTTVILSTRGNQRRAVRVGWFDFKVGATTCRLEANRLLEPGVGEKDLAVFFRDATTGKETYSVGRYIDPVALPDGRYVLDFNVAYNPACAYSEHYNCPIPPRGNRLAVAIRAGEKDAHYLH